MIFTPTNLPGATIVDVQRREDARDRFERTCCELEFEANGLATRMVQASMSLTRRAGTLRGMHYQLAPAERGARHDDPVFGVEWPVPVADLSERDRSWPDFVRDGGTR